jgi:hypothetical protein
MRLKHILIDGLIFVYDRQRWRAEMNIETTESIKTKAFHE